MFFYTLLYEPGWLWLAATVLFAALSVATGSKSLLIPMFGAGLLSAAGFGGFDSSVISESILFATMVISISIGLMVARLGRRTSVPTVAVAPQTFISTGYDADESRVVGRIAKTVSGFVNGTGRVVIEEREWPAELARGEDPVEPGEVLRVVAVTGRIKLVVERI